MRDNVKTEEVVVKLADLTPNPKNPRQIKEKNFNNLKKSVKKDKWMLQLDRIIVDENNVILSGHQRVKALLANGETEIKVCKAYGLSEEEKERVLIRSNIADGEWDMDTLANMFDADFLTDMGLEIPTGDDWVDDPTAYGKLTDDFVVPPMSVLDTRQGYWKERKNEWRGLVENRVESREETLHLMHNKFGERFQTASSLDPVLSEIICRWFCPEGGSCFDNFAGDVEFGFVAGTLGHNYTGVELRQEQVDSNTARTKGLPATYICDDGRNVCKHIKPESQDLYFSCPPYFDLEQYSDLENDASNQATYAEFYAILDEAFTNAIKCLKPNRFAVIVVGNIRDKKTGGYYDFAGDVVNTFTRNGLLFYNDMVLVDHIGTAAIRAKRYMKNRKVAKCHQNVLVFYKGDPKQIPQHFGDVAVREFDEDESTDLEL